MQKRVEEYLAKAAAADKALKDDILVKIGLCEREYSKDGQYSLTYNKKDEQVNGWYREVPIEVSDEEWQAILAAYRKGDQTGGVSAPPVTNSRASIIKAFAIIALVLGIGLGIRAGSEYSKWTGEFGFNLALPFFVAGFVSWLILMATSDVLRLLQEISNNTRK